MITGRSRGISVTSRCSIAIRGCSVIARVISAANRSRSTASAPPAGTAVRSAHRSAIDPIRRSSSFRSPTAFVSAAPRIEFEHTSSAI
jgi:hypothetical protein